MSEVGETHKADLRKAVVNKLKQDFVDLTNLFRSISIKPSGSPPTLEEQLRSRKSEHGEKVSPQTKNEVIKDTYQTIKELFDEFKDQAKGYISDSSQEPGINKESYKFIFGSSDFTDAVGDVEVYFARFGDEYFLRIRTVVGLGKKWETHRERSSAIEETFESRPKRLEYSKIEDPTVKGKYLVEHVAVEKDSLLLKRLGSEDEAQLAYANLSDCIQRLRQSAKISD